MSVAPAVALPGQSRVEPWLKSPLGPVITAPWTESLLLHGVTSWYFPLSRLWAMAEVDDPQLDALRPRVMSAAALDRAVTTVRTASAAAKQAAESWESAFFSTPSPTAETLVTIETARRDAAHQLNLTRRFFLPLRNRLPGPIRWDIVPESTVETRWAPALADPSLAFGAPAIMPAVAESAHVPGPVGRESWLRFASPRLGDTLYAHVYAPRETADPPTLIYGHGVGVEAEHWRGAIEEAAGLCLRGIRVIRAEAPWHGRRRLPGSFGGEPMFARGPDGAIEMMAAQAGEIAALVAWARSTSRGPVAIGGMSLGALAAQLALAHARSWPAALRPDAGILCATCDRLDAVMLDGTLAGAIGMTDAVLAAGWTVPGLHRWRALLEPRGEPAVDPASLVALIGRYDRITPYAHGREMMARWRVPQENLFVRPQGHFGLALGLVRDPAPMHRLAEVLHRLSRSGRCATLG